MGEAIGQQHYEGPDPGCVHQPQVLHHETAHHGSQGDADVKGGDVEAGCHVHGVRGMALGLFHHQHLQARHVAKRKGAPHQHCQHRQHRMGRREGEHQQDECQAAKHQLQRGQRAHLVRQLAAPDVADGNRDPVHQQDQAHRIGTETAHLLQDGGEEGKGGEGAAIAKRRLGVDHQQGLVGQHGELLADGRRCPLGQVARDQQQAADHGDDPECAHHQEGLAPAELLTNPGAERHACHQGDGQAAEHDGDGARCLLPGNQTRGYGRAHREEDPVGQAGEDAGDDQALVARCLPGQQVAGGEERHQPDQQPLARQLAGERRQHRRAYCHTQGVEADQEARRGERDIELLGYGGDQPHYHKFCGADRKGT